MQQDVRAATVRASEPTTTLEIAQGPFLTVLGRSPSLSIRILVKQTQRLRDADQKAIAQLRQANEELNRTLRKLERLGHSKSDFIQVSAHELRTPMAALLGYAQVMQNNSTMHEDSELRMLVDGVVTCT